MSTPAVITSMQHDAYEHVNLRAMAQRLAIELELKDRELGAVERRHEMVLKAKTEELHRLQSVNASLRATVEELQQAIKAIGQGAK